MALVGLALAGGAAGLRGQSALDGFDPNANGVVRVVVIQPDGKILIGGGFSTLSPHPGGGGRRPPPPPRAPARPPRPLPSPPPPNTRRFIPRCARARHLAHA